jgi:hypothetical protein
VHRAVTTRGAVPVSCSVRARRAVPQQCPLPMSTASAVEPDVVDIDRLACTACDLRMCYPARPVPVSAFRLSRSSAFAPALWPRNSLSASVSVGSTDTTDQTRKCVPIHSRLMFVLAHLRLGCTRWASWIANVFVGRSMNSAVPVKPVCPAVWRLRIGPDQYV